MLLKYITAADPSRDPVKPGKSYPKPVTVFIIMPVLVQKQLRLQLWRQLEKDEAGQKRSLKSFFGPWNPVKF